MYFFNNMSFNFNKIQDKNYINLKLAIILPCSFNKGLKIYYFKKHKKQFLKVF